MLGEKRKYLTIQILHNDMTVMVPCENAGRAGLRRVIGEEAVAKVLAVLRDDVSQMPKNWNRRFKHNREKIKTGDVYELAEVVRNLAIRESEKGLSTGEKQMYTRAQEDPRLRADVRARDGGGRGRGAPRLADRGRALGAAGRLGLAQPSVRRRRHRGRRQRRTPWCRSAQGVRRSGRAGRCSSGALEVLRAVCDRVVVAVPVRTSRRQTVDRACRRRRLALGVGSQRRWRRRPRPTSWSFTTPPGRSWSADLVRALHRRARGRRRRHRRRAGDRHGEGGRLRRAGAAHARPLRAVGDPDAAGVPGRRPAARRWTSTSPCSRPPPTTPRWSRRPAGTVAVVEAPRENLKVTTAARPAGGRGHTGGAVLTDYHVHLRPDEDGTAAGRVLHRRRTPSATARRRPSAGSRSWACPSTSTASCRRSTSGPTRGGARGPTTTSTRTARSSARRPTCGWGSRPTSCPAARTGWRRCSTRASGTTWSGSVHFLRDEAVDMRGSEWDVWRAGDPEKVWARYFETLGEAARTGMFDILAHPDLVKVWGGGAPVPDGDLRRFYELAMDGIAESDVAIEVSTAGLRKPVGRDLPGARRSSRCAWRPGGPVALSSDAHVPEHLGHGYERAVEWLGEIGVTELAVFERPRAAAGADRMSARSGIGYDSHRFEEGRPLVLGGVEVAGGRARPGRPLRRRRAHPRGHRRAARRRRARRHRPALPRHRRALARRRLARAAARGVRLPLRARLDRAPPGRHRDLRGAEARAAPRRDAREPVGRRRASRRWR